MPNKYRILENLQVPDSTVKNWQVIIDLLAELAEVPAALIMRVHADAIEVFTRSQNEGNVYEQGEQAALNQGLYCETVMDSLQPLHVPNALQDPAWNQNPDIQLGMIAYYGLPLTWPTGEIFGTICILDRKTNEFNDHIRSLVSRFQESILYSLETIYQTNEARQALQESAQRYHSVTKASRDGFWVVDLQGKLLEVNDAYCNLSGHTREQLLTMTINDLETVESQKDTQQHIQRIIDKGSDIFESVHIRADGHTWPVEVSVISSAAEGGRLFVFLRNIEQRKHSEKMQELRRQFSEMVYISSQDEIMRTALNTAEALTNSQIGFFHFVEKDQQTISLQVWSSRTLHEMCFAEGNSLHYPVSEAGVWVDCIHQRHTVIHNDYAALPHKKGLPDGHAPLLRELTVPIFRDQKIVAVMGVGNKQTDYDDIDADKVEQIADMAYDYVERKQAENQIEFMAYYDMLTSLPNRELLSDRLKQAISMSRRSGHLLAICYLDLDGFKPINDAYGHDLGDLLLVDFAERLKADLREGDTLARIGGDEFVILLNELSSIYDGEVIISRTLDSITEPFEIKGIRLHISGSIGVNFFPQDDADPDTLLRHADQAMYKAKSAGKSQYRLYDPVQDLKVHSHRQELDEFALALDNQQLVLYYQPRVDLASGKVTGVEALVRWQHPEKGLLSPAAFLPLIEGSPEEIMLGEWVLRSALEQHFTWLDQGTDMPVSVNISPRHIQLRGFVDNLANLLAEFPEGTSEKLELEVLETSAIGDTSSVADIMNQCAQLGVHFSLDDFGTGYSSLTYFHRLPIDVLKIDQNFVKDMLDDVRDLDIVEGVLRLADALKRPVVAEGVESVELGMMLLQLGCRYAQGYGIARPMPAAQLPSWLSQWHENSIWSTLAQETQGYAESYDLNVSIFSHRQWLNRVIDCIHTERPGDLFKLAEKPCQFGRWYHGIGKTRYGHSPVYAFIEPKHRSVHYLAHDLAELLKDKDRKQVDNKLAKIKILGQEMIDLLKKLPT
jgi:diguanylate cyclase (GGDEF)-like protein/PAS domain S-box-containing protein